jgi:hypothetical protein
MSDIPLSEGPVDNLVAKVAARITTTKNTKVKNRTQEPHWCEEGDEDCTEGGDEMASIHGDLYSRKDVRTHQESRVVCKLTRALKKFI